MALCSVHNKNRSLECLTDDGKGGYKCTRGSQCKISGGGGGGAGKGGGGDFMQQFMSAFWGGGGGGKQTPAVTHMCSTHGKRRSQQSLMADGSGGFTCAPGMECQMGSGGDHGGRRNPDP
jgi:hypothetical protein